MSEKARLRLKKRPAVKECEGHSSKNQVAIATPSNSLRTHSSYAIKNIRTVLLDAVDLKQCLPLPTSQFLHSSGDSNGSVVTSDQSDRTSWAPGLGDHPLTWEPLPPPNKDYLMTPALQPLPMEITEHLQTETICGTSQFGIRPIAVRPSRPSQVATPTTSHQQCHSLEREETGKASGSRVSGPANFLCRHEPTVEEHSFSNKNVAMIGHQSEWNPTIKASHEGDLVFDDDADDDLDEFYSSIDFSVYDKLDTEDGDQVPTVSRTISLSNAPRHGSSSGPSQGKGSQKHDHQQWVHPLSPATAAHSSFRKYKRHKVSSFVEQVNSERQDLAFASSKHKAASVIKYLQVARKCSVCNENFPCGTPEQTFDNHCKSCYADAILIDSD